MAAMTQELKEKAWKHVDHELYHLIRLHHAFQVWKLPPLPDFVVSAMRTAYAAHLRVLLEFAHTKRPKREKPHHGDITSEALMGQTLLPEWRKDRKDRLDDADKLLGHLSLGRIDREGDLRDWGDKDDLALWECIAERLLDHGDELPRSKQAWKELQRG